MFLFKHQDMMITLLICLPCLARIGRSTTIKFEDGSGYSGIVVAFSDNINENKSLMINLESYFTEASKLLYKATKRQAYFKEIAIFVPSKWNLKDKTSGITYKPNIFSNSDIRIVETDPILAENQYTLQSGICGESGNYIRFSEDLFLNTAGMNSDYMAHLIVHHWARFRYGVFQEHPDPEDQNMYPYFYVQGGKVFPTTCIANMSGWALSDKKEKCKLSHTVEDCTFYVDVKRAKHITASLMSYFCLPTMEYFCDDTPKRKHNSLAPTKHNFMCNYRSTWDVISSHADFRKISNWEDKTLLEVPPNPIFTWKKTADKIKPRFVLILDVSEIMKNEHLLTIMKDAATQFLLNLVPSGSFVGIFVSGMTDIHEEITEESVRHSLIKHISSIETEHYASLQADMRRVLRLLNQSRIPKGGAAVILISDGRFIDEQGLDESLMNEIVKSMIIIYPICLGVDAVRKLQSLATLTGGKSYFYNKFSLRYLAPGEIYLAFVEIVKSQLKDEMQPVIVTSVREDFKRKEKSYAFRIDKEIGKDTSIFLLPEVSAEINGAQIVLKEPNDRTFNPTNCQFTRRVISCKIIENTVEGKWKLIVKEANKKMKNLFLMVISHPRHGIKVPPVRIRGWLSTLEVDPSYYEMKDSMKMPIRIFVEVRKGKYPIINATAVSTILSPSRSEMAIRLLDNGCGADFKENDGIYSAYFTNITIGGLYSVSVKVENNGNARMEIEKKKSRFLSQSCIPPRDVMKDRSSSEFGLTDFIILKQTPLNDTKKSKRKVKIDQFQRFLHVGFFMVANWSKHSIKHILPGKVTDLKVVGTFVSSDSFIATLSWTAPGRYFDQGKPSRLELRGHHTRSNLIGDSFQTAFNLTHLPSPLTKPAPAGKKVIFNVNLPLHLVMKQNVNLYDDQRRAIFWYYFALRAYNGELMGEVSNIAAASFTSDTPSFNSTTSPDNVQEALKSPNNQESSSSIAWYIGGSLGIICILVIMIVGAFFALKSKRETNTAPVINFVNEAKELYYDTFW